MKNILFLIIGILTISLLILILTHKITLGIPEEWTWQYKPFKISRLIWLPLTLVACLLIFFSSFAKRCREKNLRTKSHIGFLSLVILVAFLLQLSLFYASGYNVLDLASIVISPHCSGYFSAGTEIRTISHFLRHYPQLIPQLPYHTQTHPPGSIIFCKLVNDLIQATPGLTKTISNTVQKTRQIEFGALPYAFNETFGVSLKEKDIAGAIFLGYLMAFIGSLTIIPLYFLAKEVYNYQVALLSALLFPAIPSIMLFVPEIDLLYTFIAISALCLFFVGLKRKNIWLLCLSGFTLSLGLFASFAFLVLLSLMGIYGLLWFLLTPDSKGLSKGFALFGLAFILPYVFLWLVYQFNLMQVFFISSKIHGTLTLQKVRTYHKWIFYNLFDFFIFFGLPLSIILFNALGTQIKRLRTLKPENIDIFLVGFIAGLILLDISGFVRGEVGRLWMFLMPLALIAAARRLFDYLGNKPYALYFVFILQFIQIIVFRGSLILISVL